MFNVVLRRNEVRQLVLSSPLPDAIHETYDLRMAGPWELIRDAFSCLLDSQPPDHPGDRLSGAGCGHPDRSHDGDPTASRCDGRLRAEILLLSALISAVTAFLLFLAVRRLLVLPIRRVVRHMQTYAEAPEDARRVMKPNADVVELRLAEDALKSMQTQLTGALRQKERLAQLGGAVAKISHDLRDILNLSPAFCRPDRGQRRPCRVEDGAQAGELDQSGGQPVRGDAGLRQGRGAPAATSPPEPCRSGQRSRRKRRHRGRNADHLPDGQSAGLTVRADGEQLYRILSNLVRNARQAIEATGAGGTIELSAGEEDGDWSIRVGDTGPGLPPKARENLFAAFQGGARKGGTGLGLTIAAELVRGHGGRLDLVRSDADGTEFVLHLPKDIAQPDG